MLGVSESCKNPIVCENGETGAGWENAERGKATKMQPSNAEIVQKLQNTTVECRDCAKATKMRFLNAESERKLQKCDRMREPGAGAGWENAERGKAAKTRLSNAEIVQKLPKRDRRMQRLCKTCQNATVNAESERRLQKYDRMREQGAGAGWENAERGKAAKTRPLNEEIEQNLPKCDS